MEITSCKQELQIVIAPIRKITNCELPFQEWCNDGDVLEAKDGIEGRDQKFLRAIKNHYQTDDDGFIVQIRKGQPLKSIKLPDLYTPNEWDKISKFSKNTTQRVHDGQLPHLSNGKPYILIPLDEFTDEMILFLKSIGVKATLFSSLDDLEVKDEDFLSDSSFVLQ